MRKFFLGSAVGLSFLSGLLACASQADNTEQTQDELEQCTSCPTSCGSLTYSTKKQCDDDAVEKAKVDVDFYTQKITAHEDSAAAYEEAGAEEDAYVAFLTNLISDILKAEVALQQVIAGNLQTACESVNNTQGWEVVAALATSVHPGSAAAWCAYKIAKDGNWTKHGSRYVLKEMPHVAQKVAANVVSCDVWKRGAEVKPIPLDKILNTKTVDFAHKAVPLVSIGITALQIGADISKCNKAIDKASTGPLAQEEETLRNKRKELWALRDAAKVVADGFWAEAEKEHTAAAQARLDLQTAQDALKKAEDDLAKCKAEIDEVDISKQAPVCTTNPDASCGDGGADGGDSGDGGRDGGGDGGGDSGDADAGVADGGTG